jgi:hypothetical protein
MATGNLRRTPAPQRKIRFAARTLLYYMISFQIASIFFRFLKIYCNRLFFVICAFPIVKPRKL